jgi:hypothetical protein
VSINTEIFVQITGLPLAREDPLPLFTYNSKEKTLTERMNKKYDTFRGAFSLDVASIMMTQSGSICRYWSISCSGNAAKINY